MNLTKKLVNYQLNQATANILRKKIKYGIISSAEQLETEVRKIKNDIAKHSRPVNQKRYTRK